MKSNNSKSNKKLMIQKIILTVIGILVAIYGIFSFFWRKNNLNSLQKNDSPATVTSAEKNPNSIAIPGYELLELQSNSTVQTLCLTNPEQNTCFFQFSLYLEDGTLLWQSELIAPGTKSEPIVLTKPLGKGTYPNAILKYSCFQMDGVTPLNGAETKLTLWVK